jgi:antitoxin component of RelBE/YafQ-DinJ toxin-antitoxin module
MSKKDEQINVAVPEALKQRAERLEKKTGIKPTEMGRVGLVEVLNRLEGGLPLMLTVSPDVLRAVAECYAQRLDPLLILRNALGEIERDAALRSVPVA